MCIRDSYRAADLPSAGKGEVVEVKAGSSPTIETKGRDEAWLRLHAKADVTYVLRTLGLNPGEADIIDTVIEVYERERPNRPIASDDDGGEVDNGESWSSLVSITPKRDSEYHIRLRNIDSGRGTFVFTVIERQAAGGNPTNPL